MEYKQTAAADHTNEGTTRTLLDNNYMASLIKYYYYITLHTMLLCTCLIKTADQEDEDLVEEMEEKQEEELVEEKKDKEIMEEKQEEEIMEEEEELMQKKKEEGREDLEEEKKN